jgi:hypothetical protein
MYASWHDYVNDFKSLTFNDPRQLVRLSVLD